MKKRNVCSKEDLTSQVFPIIFRIFKDTLHIVVVVVVAVVVEVRIEFHDSMYFDLSFRNLRLIFTNV